MRADHVTFRSGPQIDMPLLVAVVAITTLGVVNLYSATSYYLAGGELSEKYVSQIYWVALGVLFAILVAAIDYRNYERLAMVVYLGGLVSLALVFVLGADIRGSKRWLFNVQPSEFVKILVILVVAKYLHNDPKTEPRTLVDLLLPFLLGLIPAVAVLAQPDLGTAIIYMLTTCTMLAMTRIQPKSVAALFAATAVGIPLFLKYGIKEYQYKRIDIFLNPEKDLQGAGYHALQSRTAVGNGGLTGEGFMKGTQNQFGFLPDRHSDFPFAVFAEEWGLLGSVILLALYAFVCIWSVHVASQAKDRFGAALSIGVGAMFFWHTIANLGMELGLLPVVGITLPLFSAGGSSVVTMMIGLGLLMNVSMRR
jgi:rod shape determining protein RodA